MLSGGGLFVDRPHLLSRDGSQLFVCCVDNILAFSTATGEQIYKLQPPSVVTALCLHPDDDSRLYSASVDGMVTMWDLGAGAAVQQWPLELPIESLVVAETAIYVSCHWRQRHAGRLFTYDLAKGAAASGRAKVSAARRLVASSCGQLLATVDRHTVMVWQAAGFPHSPLVLTHTKALTCLALASDGDILAVGDVTGRVVLWRGVASAVRSRGGSGGAVGVPQLDVTELRLAQSTVHWHADAVRCLAFSPDDVYLLSGGHEGVLVVWDISSGRRTYLPRLGSCMRDIAPCSGDPSRVAVSLAENVIRVVDVATMHVRCSVRGICCDPAAPPMARMVVQPSTGHLVLASTAATLQLFDPLRDAHVDRLQLCNLGSGCTVHSSAVAQLADSKQALPVHITFSAGAEMLVTVEQILDMTGSPASVLKAWRRSDVQAYGRTYVLSGTEGNPCSVEAAITAAALHPDQPLVALALGCGSIRFFKLDALHSDASWTMGAPSTLQGGSINALAFSSDGSLLALGAAAGSPVLLVDPVSQQMLAALPPALEDSDPAPLRHLAFLREGLHLVSQWDAGIATYDLLTGRPIQVSQLPVALLAVDAHAAGRCAISTQQGVLVFEEGLGPPVDALGLLHPFQVQATAFLELGAAGCVPKDQAASGVVVLNDVQQYAALLPPRLLRSSSDWTSVEATSAKLPLAAEPQTRMRHGRPRQSKAFLATQCTQSASHVLPAVSELCPLSLELLLLAGG